MTLDFQYEIYIIHVVCCSCMGHIVAGILYDGSVPLVLF